MNRRIVLAGLVFVLALAACGRAAGGENGATASDTVTVAASQPPTATPAVPGAMATVAALPPVAPDTPLLGPLIGFYIEGSSQGMEEVFFSIFDAGTRAFRAFQNARVDSNEAQWFGDGCFVYSDGQLFDLTGATVWFVPPEAGGEALDLHNSRLSPGRDWLAVVSYPGEATATRPQAVDVDAVQMVAPFARTRLTERGGGSAGALLWSPDGAWLYTSDYDAGGILQVYRRHPDGSGGEQLTAHDAPIGQINALALSPDGARLAYGVRNLLTASRPYTYSESDEGWVGIVDLATGAARQARLPGLGAVESGRGLVWDAGGERLLVIGDSLPVAADDPLAGRQVHWITADGQVERSFRQADTPNRQMGWITPLGDIDTLLFSSSNDVYRYENGAARQARPEETPPVGLELGRRTVGVLPATVAFAGEAACTR